MIRQTNIYKRTETEQLQTSKKKITKEKITKRNNLLEIYQYIHI